VEPTTVKVTRNGQVSLPAALRHRWAVGEVIVVDRGDYAVVRPVVKDPIRLLRGAYAGPGPTTEEARAMERSLDPERGTKDGARADRQAE